MSQSNVDWARRMFAEPNPLSAFAAHMAPDIEFDFTAIYPDQPVLRGVNAMRRFRDAGPWGGSVHFDPEPYFDVDDERVLVFVRASATGQGSGVPIESRLAHEFRFRDGLLVGLKVYLDRAEALRAVWLQA